VKFATSTTGVKRVGGTVYVTINDADACRVSVFKGGGVEDLAWCVVRGNFIAKAKI
jgi:hypothetical protein